MFSLALTLLTCAAASLAAAPTWPSSVDEMEDIMFLNTGYRARGFATAVTPCSFSAQGNGRITAAEWMRTAFHDMATGNVFTGMGGLDASLMFETNNGDNIGAVFNTTLTTFAPFLSTRSSMADIIALGIYTSVRSCGGPVVPIKAGRIDATAGGPSGVPLPQNAIGTFLNQFSRVGFNQTEMIAVTACGHSLGGVHAADFPQIVAPGTVANDFQHFDSTTAFDEKVCSEYVAGTTTNPLAGALAKSNARDSDTRVFASDGNVTVKAMSDPATFSSVCQSMLQKMIEVVPTGTVLTDRIVAYEAKPYAMQLTLLDGGSSLSFAGEVRIRTTSQPASKIATVQLMYKDRNGGITCGSCTIATSYKGTAAGFDDSFAVSNFQKNILFTSAASIVRSLPNMTPKLLIAIISALEVVIDELQFYAFSSEISTSTSISSFNVLLTLTDGTNKLYDNNGNGFGVQDTVIFQQPQSCLGSSADVSGNSNLTVVAAVRNTAISPAVNLTLTLKVPRTFGVIPPELQKVSLPMQQKSSIGSYTLYAASYSANATQTSKFDVSIGSGSSLIEDSFKDVTGLPATCAALSSNTTTSITSSNFTYQGCFTDSSTSRTLSGTAYYGDAMTVESCASSCINFQYFGAEYGGECYCGNSFNSSETLAGEADCDMACSGNAQEICGAGNRLSLYKNLLYAATANPNITGYTYQGCYNDSVYSRTLSGSSTISNSLTVESCATFCSGATYFGVEYRQECYCGSSLSASSTKQTDSDCSYACAGKNSEYCGAGNRINIYRKSGSASSVSSTTSPVSTSNTTNVQSATAVSSSSSCLTPTSNLTIVSSTQSSTISSSSSVTSTSVSATPSARVAPAFAGYGYQGCYIDSVDARILTSKTEITSSMTYSVCASYCSGYTLFGVEYGSECYCGNALADTASKADETDCNIACSGNATQTCGAGNRMAVFNSSAAATAPSNPYITGFNYTGCFEDSVSARVLSNSNTYDTAMTVEKCASFCKGYTYFGNEYATECYCGSAFSSTQVADSECSYLCPGNSTELCGAANRLSVYTAMA